MRKTVLALIIATAALVGGHACAMEGFDLGDMPPLPPPLLDSGDTGGTASSPLAPPPAVSLTPPVEAQASAPAGLTPLPPPQLGGTAAGDDFLAPPPPPPLAPPPITPPATAPAATAAVLSPAGAPAIPGGGATAPVVLNETPQPGRITGGRVNVRAGPNTQYESIAVLTSGAPVTVMARHGDWYKIVFPADQLASIHKSLVTAEITGEIPETGLPGVVNAANAEVHAFYWDRSTVVGTLNQGDPVVIKQERGQWYRIDAPATARAFVSAQYVRLEGGGQVVADAAPAPVNPAVDLTAGTDPQTGAIKLSENDRRVAELKEQYFKRIKDQYDAEIAAEEAAYQAAVDANKRQAEQLDLALKDLDGRLAAIDQETSQRMTYMAQAYQPTIMTTVGAAEWAPPDPATGGYTGWVENIGRVGGAPSAHRLTKGGEIRFYLRSGAYNLDEFNGRRVWVNGPVEPASGASAAVLDVQQARILTELEIAAGMQAGYAQQPSYAQPPMGGMVQAQPYGAPQPYPVAAPQGYPAPQMYGEAQAFPAPQGFGEPMTYGVSSYEYGTAAPMAPAPGAPAPAASAQAPMSAYDPALLNPGEVYMDPYAAVPIGTVVDAATMQQYMLNGMDGTMPGAMPDTIGAQPQAVPTPVPSAMPQPGGMMPSDPSQLPDVVGSGSTVYPMQTTQTFGIDDGLGSPSLGEVESDMYDRPVISEIGPE